MADQQNDLQDERVKQAKIVRRIVVSVIAIIVLAVLAIGLIGFLFIQSTLQPVDKDSEKTVEVEIPIGSTPATIGQILEEKEIIKNGTVFKYYVTYKNEQGLQAGQYELSPSMEIDEIIQALKEGKLVKKADITFTIPEGTTLEGIADLIAESTEYKKEEVVDQFNNESYVKKLIKKYDFLEKSVLKEEVRHPLEGYLFPARYDVYEENAALPQMIEEMLERMGRELAEYSEELKESDLSVHEVLTLASIVEREARNQEDRPVIAGVLLNRLEKGMRLEVDPTVAYAMGEHQSMTSYDDLEVESPYNTYKNEGLPPGPIASPGLPAIEAVLQPEENDYIYFYARPNGEVIYNKDYEEHLEVRDKYRSEWEEATESE